MSAENINTVEEQVESQEHVDAMIAKGEQLEANNNPDTPERPDWLPEKFKSPEDMAEAYANLESKLGSNDQQEQEEAPEEEYQEEYTEDDVQNAEASDVVDAVENAGIDFEVLQNEYNELGGLSDDAYEALEESGFSKDLVNSWIAGQEALNNNFQTSVFNEVGGQESYMQMVDWAADNLSPQEITAYDRAVDSGDINMVKLAIAGLKTQYQAAEGSDPSFIDGQSATSTGGNYGSWAEVTSAMKDSRYESDPAYRQQVQTKLGRSQL